MSHSHQSNSHLPSPIVSSATESHAASEHDEVGAMPPAPQPARWKLALITSLAVMLAVGVFYFG